MTLELKIVGVYDDTHNGKFGAPKCVLYTSRSLLDKLHDDAGPSGNIANPVVHPVYGSVCLVKGLINPTSCRDTLPQVTEVEVSGKHSSRSNTLDAERSAVSHTYTEQDGEVSSIYQTAYLDPIKAIDSETLAGDVNIDSLQFHEVIISELLSAALSAGVGDSLRYIRRMPSAAARRPLQSIQIVTPWRRLTAGALADVKATEGTTTIPDSIVKVLLRGTPVCTNGVISIVCYGQPVYARVRVNPDIHNSSENIARTDDAEVQVHTRCGEDTIHTGWIGAVTEITMTQKMITSASLQVIQISRPNLDVGYTTSEMYARLGYSHQTLSDLVQLTNASISHADTSHCLLLTGPSGCGKSFAAQSLVEVLRECDVACQYVSGSRLFTTTEGAAENNLYALFQSSNQVLVIDDVDALCPSGTAVANSGGGSVPIRRLTAVFLECLQKANSRGNITVIGITCRLHTMDTAARNAGRFDVLLNMSHPTSSARLGVLYKLTGTKDRSNTNNPSKKDDTISRIDNNYSTARANGSKSSIPLHPEAAAYLPDVAQMCHGFSMADLQRLCTEAALHAIREQLALTLLHTDTTTYTKENLVKVVNPMNPADTLGGHAMGEETLASGLDVQSICVHKSDIDYALLEVSPSSLVEFKGVMLTETNTIHQTIEPINPAHTPHKGPPPHTPSPGQERGFNRLKGMRETVDALRDSVLMPLLHSDLCAAMGIPPPAGLLLAGPHGTGKTVLAQAIAHEAKLKVIVINGSELRTRVVGESEKALARIFESAREAAPCMLLFEQIDIIASARTPNDQGSDRLLTTLLTELDGVGGPGSGLMKTADTNRRVFVVGTTTRPEVLDSAINRPGRLDLHFDLPLPNAHDRAEILRYYLDALPGGATVCDELVQQIAHEQEGFSGADLEAVARETAMDCLRHNIHAESVSNTHLQRAIAQFNQ